MHFATTIALSVLLLGQDPEPPTRTVPGLIYRFDIEDAIARGLLPANSDPNAVMSSCLEVLEQRLVGVTPEAQLRRQGTREVVVTLPAISADGMESVREWIESARILEMRLLASDDYRSGDAAFDLAREKLKLEQWLERDDNRASLSRNPARIREFNDLPIGTGRISEYLRWYPRKIFASANQKSWDYAATKFPGFYAVPAFRDRDYEAPPPAPIGDSDRPFLVEFIPVNMHATTFTAEDLAADRTKEGVDPEQGEPCVFYEMRDDKKAAYAEWSERNIGRASAIIVNGYVRSTPVFASRIPGSGIIRGALTQGEVKNLVQALRSGAYLLAPRLVVPDAAKSRR